MADEDTKPKLNLNIDHEGTHITVKVRASMPFRKIFEAAEKRFGKEPGTFRFHVNGERLNPDDTPASRGLEDGDVIDAQLGQEGGFTPIHLATIRILSSVNTALFYA